MDGIIVKAVGGFYFVRAGETVLKCAIRGKIRRRLGQAMVGDMVDVRPVEDGEGVVEEILPRRTRLTRPPVANVDRAVVVFAFKQPEPSAALLDRFLVQVHAAGITPAICFNKYDLLYSTDTNIDDYYKNTGYQILQISAKTGYGLEQLPGLLKNHISVLAGPSGVGKSSILNALQPGWNLQTGVLSHRLGRGKHTTRHVELIPIPGGGLVADTPGFSSLNLPPLGREQLGGFYPEFDKYARQCRFNSCLHYREPGCAVKEAMRQGSISGRRYQNYLIMLEEVIESERR